ncbi:aldo/keto reductase [Histomonas meleagridis]|uniref:aldo/keto reductase n=1 Tax=Histomonas meleagridis TaxID=135588 RepID=UPI00355A4445|nr:aldo/keto reductase [Histomonas meleagridis]KAH0801476.1 aldo/keto reductase [Histomonas meleagridis]
MFKKNENMEYIQLGKSDLIVSRICCGCMSFGDKTKWIHEWLLDEEQSDEIVKKALELGINFFDTANGYAAGTSEEMLGRAIKKFAKREDVIIATKVYFNEGRLSKPAILREVDRSLARLGMDYIDLLIIHRWDYSTPIEETMEALNEVVKSGKVRYIGASAMYAYQFLKAQEVARQHGWVTFISMQDHYNLIYREEEREMFKLLREEGVMSTPYSPLASGRLVRDWDAETLRSKTDEVAKGKYDSTRDQDMIIVQKVKEIAEKRGISRTQVALAWLLSKSIVAAPIVGATKVQHLVDAVGAVKVKLTQEEIDELEKPYVPHHVVGPLDPEEAEAHFNMIIGKK